jgi:hypothetical protein
MNSHSFTSNTQSQSRSVSDTSASFVNTPHPHHEHSHDHDHDHGNDQMLLDWTEQERKIFDKFHCTSVSVRSPSQQPPSSSASSSASSSPPRQLRNRRRRLQVGYQSEATQSSNTPICHVYVVGQTMQQTTALPSPSSSAAAADIKQTQSSTLSGARQGHDTTDTTAPRIIRLCWCEYDSHVSTVDIIYTSNDSTEFNDAVLGSEWPEYDSRLLAIRTQSDDENSKCNTVIRAAQLGMAMTNANMPVSLIQQTKFGNVLPLIYHTCDSQLNPMSSHITINAITGSNSSHLHNECISAGDGNDNGDDDGDGDGDGDGVKGEQVLMSPDNFRCLVDSVAQNPQRFTCSVDFDHDLSQQQLSISLSFSLAAADAAGDATAIVPESMHGRVVCSNGLSLNSYSGDAGVNVPSQCTIQLPWPAFRPLHSRIIAAAVAHKADQVLHRTAIPVYHNHTNMSSISVTMQ